MNEIEYLKRTKSAKISQRQNFDPKVRVSLNLSLLIVAPQPFMDDRGTPIAVSQVVSALSSLGHHTDVLTFPMGRDVEWRNTQILRCANPFGIKKVKIGFSLKKVVLDLFLCLALIRRLQSHKYDLIHVVEEMALPTLMLARFHRTPIIYDMQSSLPQQLVSHAVLGRTPAQQLLRAIEKYMLNNAHLVVCSAGLLGHVRGVAPNTQVTEWQYIAEKLRVQPESGVLQHMRQSLGIDECQPVVLYAGNFEHYQGLSLLIEAIPDIISAVPDVKILLVGKTASDRLEPAGKVAALQQQGRLIIVNRQPREKVLNYLSIADVLVSPRLQGDNAPLKLFTYMAARKAVVATDIKAHHDLLADDRGLLVDKTPYALAEGVIKLLTNDTLRSALAQKASDYVNLHNHDSAFAERLNSLLDIARRERRKSDRKYKAVSQSTTNGSSSVQFQTVSVIIPARNEQNMIGRVVQSVKSQSSAVDTLEIIVVDDGSTDQTASIARKEGAAVITSTAPGATGNPAAARNLGAERSIGDPLVFLDSDCIVGENWLESILAAHKFGFTIVGGALDLPDGLQSMARCDYYCGWYLIHPDSKAGIVSHHPPPNLSVRRLPFLASMRFATEPPFDYTNEERFWQAELKGSGHQIYFEPRAVACHYNRPGFLNLLKRNYRWGYTAVEAKSKSGAARIAWLYRYPLLLIPAAPVLVIAHTVLIIGCWLRAGKLEPLAMLPLILASRITYVAGMIAGAVQWLRHKKKGQSDKPRQRPNWQ